MQRLLMSALLMSGAEQRVEWQEALRGQVTSISRIGCVQQTDDVTETSALDAVDARGLTFCLL